MMICGVKRGEVTSKRRRALSCISNSHRPLPKNNPTSKHTPSAAKKTTTPSKNNSLRLAAMDKENTPLLLTNGPDSISAKGSTFSRRSKQYGGVEQHLPQALSQLHLASGGGHANLPLDRQTARRLINKHFSGATVVETHAPPNRSSPGPVSGCAKVTGSRFQSDSTATFSDNNDNTKDKSLNSTKHHKTMNSDPHPSVMVVDTSSHPHNQLTDTQHFPSQKSLNCSSIPTIQQSHIDLRSRSDTTLRQPTKRSRTESTDRTAHDLPMTTGRVALPGGDVKAGSRTVSASGDYMCVGKRRAVAIASHMAGRYGLDARGLLRINLSAKEDHITIEVVEAAQLKSNWSDLCSAFVKVEICPSISGARSVQTSVQEASNQPLIQQTLTVETCREDLQKRLVISVWHADPTRRCSEFVGCLSFGIRHLAFKTRQNQPTGGWYYILPESMGHRKHILAEYTGQQVTSATAEPIMDPQCTLPRHSPKVEEQCTRVGVEDKSIDFDCLHAAPTYLNETNSHNLVLKTIELSQGSGYGFTVHSTHPVTVSRVRAGSAAEEAGLHAGDVITAVNQCKVHAHTAREVATLVRQAGEKVTLDILCPHYTQSMQQYLSNLNPQSQSPSAPSQSVISHSNQSLHSITSSQYAHLVRKRSTNMLHPQRAKLQGHGDALRYSAGSATGAGSEHTNWVSRCISDNVLTPKATGKSGKRSRTQAGFSRSRTYSVMNRTRSYEKALNDESVLKWDPSLSHISACSQTNLHPSYRNESYLEAVSPPSRPSSRRSLNNARFHDNTSHTTDRNDKENSPFVKPTLKTYSTFSLATEAEVVSTGTPRRRKRVVRRRLGCKKRLSLTGHRDDESLCELNNTSVAQTPSYPLQNTPVQSPASIRGAQSMCDDSNRVSIVPYGHDSATDSDSTMCSYQSTTESELGKSRLGMSSYGTPNAGFMFTDTFNNSILSCTLESDYYSDDSLQTSPMLHTPLRVRTTPRTPIANDYPRTPTGNDSPRMLADGTSSTGSVDEMWVLVSPRSQDALMEGLRACEQRFIKAMTVGFRKYLWPARTMLSAQCFRQIFNNIEKLVALSQFLEQQVTSELSRGTPLAFQTLLQLYAEKLPLLVEAYRTYRLGYDSALEALAAAKLHTLSFQQFVQHACAQPPAFSLDDLLLFPLHHVAELVNEFEAVHVKYPEHEHLVNIVCELGAIIEDLDLNHLENASSCAPSEAEES